MWRSSGAGRRGSTAATFRAMKLSPEAALEKCIGEQPVVLERMKKAERVAPVYSAGDYSYRNAQLSGERWLLAGDAAGFIDPAFSSGVFLAIMSAEKADPEFPRFYVT